MTSSMLTGEKRWTSARRGGMTVLGKVAVPKPINLPSQRLENHGLDPNVEIVPKGTLSWGSRPSSSSSNAWGSSTLSPNTDGSAGSPRQLSGRPSSGGSGTRPSTAGSDKAHEPITNAWGSDSRPSSASGVLASSQTSLTPLRPRSAETRPRSSQLSRFAEPLSDNTVTWGASAAAEKLGVVSSKNDNFSLSAGDFPTLGSEKETSARNVESQDHGPYGRPGSSSGDTLCKEGDTPPSANVKGGTGPSWRRDNFPYNEEGTRTVVEKWQTDNQPYPNTSIPPKHYDEWHSGPPVNNHPVGWYPGPPGGPPFGGPVHSGGFPMESFPYYRPQILSGAPPGGGPRGPHPKNGDMYRPHMHDAYMRPGMPLRPGFFPGPVPYEGFYGPPLGFCGPNEPDIPFMRMPVAPASYNRFSEQNAPDPGNTPARSSGHGPTGKAIASKKVESGHSQDDRGPYRVLLKHRDGWAGNDGAQNWDDSMIIKSSHPVEGDLPGKSWENNDFRTNEKKNEGMDTVKVMDGEDFYSDSASCKGVSSSKFKSPEDAGSSKIHDDSTVKKPRQMENAACAFPGSFSATSDSSLIQKIEGLNAKTRASDGRKDVKSATGKVEGNNNLQTGNAMLHQSANEPVNVSLSVDRTYVSGTAVTHELHSPPADKSFRLMGSSGTTTTGISNRNMHVRADHRSKGRFSAQEAERWHKRSHVSDSSSTTSSVKFGSAYVHDQDHTSAEVTDWSRPSPRGRDDESVPHNADRTDSLAQRAKMKELAKQRLKQRDEVEEERTRHQKAKALAKLEELNRHTQAGEDTTQNSETTVSAVTGNKKEELGSVTESTPASVTGANSSAVAESRAIRDDKSNIISSQVQLVVPKANYMKGVEMINQSQTSQLDVRNADDANLSGASKQKRVGQRQKQDNLEGNISNEKTISSSEIEASKNVVDVVADATVSLDDVPKETESNCESCLTVTSSAMVESSVHHKKKNRSGKNKQKAESSLSYGLPLMVSKDPTVQEISVENAKTETFESDLVPSSVQHMSKNEDANVVLEKQLVETKSTNQWKSQNSRKMPRNIQANKSTEKSHGSDTVFWAPVLPRNKTEVADGTNQKSVVEVAGSYLKSDQQGHLKSDQQGHLKSDQQGQNNPRNKRAEMERYVPKPVAKEMAQQGGTQQSLTPVISQSSPDEAVVKGESGSPESSQTATAGMGKLPSFTESRNGDGRRNKLGKVHGSWRQRGSVESTFTSNSGVGVPKSVDHGQSHNSDATSKEYSSCCVESSTSDGWNMLENCDAPVKMSLPKDHNLTSRAKQQPHKGHRGMRSNSDPDIKRVNRQDTENFHALSSISEELLTTTKDNRSVALSHWQPKAQGHTTNQPARAHSGHNVGSEIVEGSNKDTTPPGGVPLPLQPDTEYAAAEGKPYPDHSSSKGNLEEARNDTNHEAKRGRKVTLHKGRPSSPVELTFSADFQIEHRASSGLRKNVNQNSRYGKDFESHGNWSESGKDKKQHTVSSNWERQRHNSHFEYQPIGPQNINKAKFEVSKDGSYNSGSRYRDKRNGYPRRGGGNFYGRQSGSVQVESSDDYRPNSS